MNSAIGERQMLPRQTIKTFTGLLSVRARLFDLVEHTGFMLKFFS
jgi:hypothetical protein